MEKPILFNTAMVQAIIEGKKIVTRRLIKNKYPNADIRFFENKYGKRLVHMQNDAPEPVKLENGWTRHSLIAMEEINKPYQVGDILYVRETWCDTSKDLKEDSELEIGDCKYIFKVDDLGEKHPIVDIDIKRWRPSIHMPKEAARVFLRVISIRAERLQEIQDSDCLKEGIREYSKAGNVIKYAVNEEQFHWFDMPRNPLEAFKILWNTTVKKDAYKEYGFEANPWVWVIEFKKVDKE
ncbi:hypothetical protein [Clostridium gasigenes]|uniref:ASCH domain-containing protein n=1 Tax=Clostridium gasigenes TaxID=94869 RepID=A0A1H0N431_9CLOT|nr:hypothetical protein [Clostridium gasigenes]SDO87474.1 hypothetical protein SAMN04488529_101682 [Clostridium gasigenes]